METTIKMVIFLILILWVIFLSSCINENYSGQQNNIPDSLYTLKFERSMWDKAFKDMIVWKIYQLKMNSTCIAKDGSPKAIAEVLSNEKYVAIADSLGNAIYQKDKFYDNHIEKRPILSFCFRLRMSKELDSLTGIYHKMFKSEYPNTDFDNY